MTGQPGEAAGSLEQPLPLSEVARGIKLRIDAVPNLWVTGELQRMNRTASGTFMTLVDEASSARRPATLTLRVSESSLAVLARRPATGDRLVVLARLAYWPSSAQVAGQAWQVHLAGDGAILERIEQLRRMLAAEGLFDPGRKKPLPKVPSRVGLIVPRESAAEADVTERCRERFEPVRFRVRYAAMQGPDCPRQVAACLAELDADEEVDVIVIARGGGSLADLAAFSDEMLVRQVAACGTPVVSAIGHEIDRPLLDEVADARAGTPTQAAALVVPDLSGELQSLASAASRLDAGFVARWRTSAMSLQQVASRGVLADPLAPVQAAAVGVDAAAQRLSASSVTRLQLWSSSLEASAASLAALSPLSTLRRGYAVVQRADGHLVVAPEDAPAGQPLRVVTAHGAVAAVSSGPCP